jgi:hypothetical protein
MRKSSNLIVMLPPRFLAKRLHRHSSREKYRSCCDKHGHQERLKAASLCAIKSHGCQGTWLDRWLSHAIDAGDVLEVVVNLIPVELSVDKLMEEASSSLSALGAKFTRAHV